MLVTAGMLMSNSYTEKSFILSMHHLHAASDVMAAPSLAAAVAVSYCNIIIICYS